MLRKCAVLIGGFVAALLVLVVSAQDELFTAEDKVIVLGEASVVMIYSQPDATSRIVEATVSGIILTVIDGPEERDGVRWWKIRSPSGSEGWLQYMADNRPVIGLEDSENSTETVEELSVGEHATVITSTFVLVYKEPDTDAQPLEALISGFRVLLIEGPEVVNELVWWRVESPSGVQGWLPESIDGNSILFTDSSLISLTPTATPTPSPTVTPLITSTATRAPVLLSNGRGLTDGRIMNNGEMQIEGYCQSLGRGTSDNGTDWFCTGAGGNRKLELDDFNTICRRTYNNPGAFALQGRQASRPSHNWRCYGYVESSSLAVGQTVIVNTTRGDRLNLRSGASTSSQIIARLDNGTQLTIVGGPQDGSGYVWWQVRFGSQTGWVVESADGVRTLIQR